MGVCYTPIDTVPNNCDHVTNCISHPPASVPAGPVKHVLNDSLLGSSIYLNIALAGITLLLITYMARNVADPRAKLIFVSVMSVSAVSIASYTGLASGLTISILEMPEGHALYDTVTALSHSGEKSRALSASGVGI